MPLKKEVEEVEGNNGNEPQLPIQDTLPDAQPLSHANHDDLDTPSFSTPRPRLASISVALIATSPLSSPPAEDPIETPFSLRPETYTRLANATAVPGSSPLSSPPPMLFDASPPASPSPTGTSRRSSTTPSEPEDCLPTLSAFGSSQTSTSGRQSLPNMKGKDMFDASIWSDPTRTSVFYTFATSLRQKVRGAEPTSSHKFISHLRDRGKLVRCYTQNIDQIEEKVGLSTSLQDGPGSRGRFSRRSTANAKELAKMVDEGTSGDSSDTPASEKLTQADNESSQPSQTPALGDSSSKTPTEHDGTPVTDEIMAEAVKPEPSQTEEAKTEPSKASLPLKKEQPRSSGVECVFLHGSLELLRCFLCGRVCSWDDDEREVETMSGQQPECPHCVGATAAREERGKRALGVGKLRPDIVLYGEEHPNAHLISPIVTHDLALYPDMLLILGTSLRVHGLKVMVREFAKTVHSKGGKVVFVNFTKPPESSWGDIIDYWVQWDCDTWVSDLQDRIPKLWQAPEPPKLKKKRDSDGGSEDSKKQEKKRPPAANPVALRDTRVTGAYCTSKILKELRRISGRVVLPERRASIGTSADVVPPKQPVEGVIETAAAAAAAPAKPVKVKAKRPRKSAPGALEKPKRTPSTLNPNHGRSRKQPQEASSKPSPPAQATPMIEETSSILHSVKANPRLRKKKVFDGEEVMVPTVGKGRGCLQSCYQPTAAELELPPLRPACPGEPESPYGRPQPMEPRSPPAGPPLASLSVNLRTYARPHPFYLEDPLVTLLATAPTLLGAAIAKRPAEVKMPMTDFGTKQTAEADAALALAGLRTGSPVVTKVACTLPRGVESDLRLWGATWNAAAEG